MGFHHLALVTRDTKATHEFYTTAMGFRLVKVEVAPTPEGGWAKHFFYDTGGEGMIAFWELHDESIAVPESTAIGSALGLPVWTNHLAFSAESRDELDASRKRWVQHGHDVLEVDHEWCISVYTLDPNGIMVEFCHTTRPFRKDEILDARRLLEDDTPKVLEKPGETRVYRAGASD